MRTELRSKQREHVERPAERAREAPKTERVERPEEKAKVQEPDRVAADGENDGARFRRAGLQPERSLRAPHVDELGRARNERAHDTRRFAETDQEVMVKNRNERVAQLPPPMVAPFPAPAPAPRLPAAPIRVEPRRPDTVVDLPPARPGDHRVDGKEAPVDPGMRPVEIGEGPPLPGMRPVEIGEGPPLPGMRPVEISEGPPLPGMRPVEISEGPPLPGMRSPADPAQNGARAAAQAEPVEEGPLVIGGGNNRATHPPLRGDSIGLDIDPNVRPAADAARRLDAPRGPDDAGDVSHLPGGPFDVRDVLRMSPDEFATNPEAQRRLYEAATQLRDTQNAAATKVLGDLGIAGGEAKSILKRDNFDDFVHGVSEKLARKNYPDVGTMPDMARGRFNLDGPDDVRRVSEELSRLNPGAEVVEPRTGYPRYHVVVTDPATGLKHEWQVGTKATTDFLETNSVRIPEGLHLSGAPNFHDVHYDYISKIKDPNLRAEYGLDAFTRKYDELLIETGNGMPPNFTARYDQISDELSQILARIHRERPGFLEGLSHK